ncbi:MAG: fimbrial biogenesis outer membrane usher protein [Bdellovibrionaceae bacterium]|nr:fimbrial biogenesis outer membrane usher protein [Pseudobdellovibrionaceae bacterium]
MTRVLFLLFFIHVTVFASAQTPGARPVWPAPFLDAPVFISGLPVGQLWMFPRERQTDFMVQAAPMLAILRDQMQAPLVDGLARRVRPEGVLSLADLETSGVSARFDERTLILHLEIPLKNQRRRTLDVLNSKEPEAPVPPAEHSGYLNFRAVRAFTYGDVGGPSEPLTGSLDLVENLHGVVFESGADFQEGDDRPWRRADTRLRFDDEGRMNRWTLGDLGLRSVGFQRTPSMGGFSLVREFSIQPYRTLRPLSRHEVLIKRPSLLELYVNGFLLSQMRLAPGVFNIKDFPLVNGQTAVKIRVVDDLGQEEVYDFSVLFENTLLNEGESEFSYSVGSPWHEQARERIYHGGDLLGSFYHRYGITSDLTVGANVQAFADQSLVGGEISGISSFGSLSLEFARSQSALLGKGLARKLRYRSLESQSGQGRPFVLLMEAETRDEAFSPVQQWLPSLALSDYMERYDAQLSFRSLNRLYMTVGGEYQSRPRDDDRRVYRASLSLPLQIRSRVEFSLSRTIDSQTEDRGMVSFYWSERQGVYSASAYADSAQQRQSVTVSRNNRQPYDDVRADASIGRDATGSDGQLMVEGLWQPLSLRLDHHSRVAQGQDVHRTALGLNSGIAWAGGQWALTQPVNDSFTLVHAKGLPDEAEVALNPNGETSSAKLVGGRRTATVLRDQTAYYDGSLRVDPTSLPQGSLLGREFYRTRPTYRSGTLISLDVQNKVSVKGRLIKTGRPLGLLSGEVYDAKGKLVDNAFFTSEDGVFFLEGLESGTYVIKLSLRSLPEIHLVVPAESKGHIDYGEIKISGGGTR